LAIELDSLAGLGNAQSQDGWTTGERVDFARKRPRAENGDKSFGPCPKADYLESVPGLMLEILDQRGRWLAEVHPLGILAHLVSLRDFNAGKLRPLAIKADLVVDEEVYRRQASDIEEQMISFSRVATIRGEAE